MKRLLALILWPLLSCTAWAAPFLVAEPYPATAVQPDSASFTVNGGAAVACVIETVSGGVRPKCDLASITAPGTYTIVVTVTKAGGIVNGTSTATNTAGSTASSAPFSYRLVTAPVAGPTLTVNP